MVSFFGSNGILMKGCGLEFMFGEIYADNTLAHITSGKAVSRALRVHFFTEAALHFFLFLVLVFDDMNLAKKSFLSNCKILHNLKTAKK